MKYNDKWMWMLYVSLMSLMSEHIIHIKWFKMQIRSSRLAYNSFLLVQKGSKLNLFVANRCFLDKSHTRKCTIYLHLCLFSLVFFFLLLSISAVRFVWERKRNRDSLFGTVMAAKDRSQVWEETWLVSERSNVWSEPESRQRITEIINKRWFSFLSIISVLFRSPSSSRSSSIYF